MAAKTTSMTKAVSIARTLAYSIEVAKVRSAEVANSRRAVGSRLKA